VTGESEELDQTDRKGYRRSNGLGLYSLENLFPDEGAFLFLLAFIFAEEAEGS